MAAQMIADAQQITHGRLKIIKNVFIFRVLLSLLILSTFWEEKKQKREKTNCSDQQKHGSKKEVFSDVFS